MLHYLGVVLCGFALGTCLALAYLCRELIHPVADVNKLGICFCQSCVAGASNVSVLTRLSRHQHSQLHSPTSSRRRALSCS